MRDWCTGRSCCKIDVRQFAAERLTEYAGDMKLRDRQDRQYKTQIEQMILDLNRKPEPARTEQQQKKVFRYAIVIGLMLGLLPFAAGGLLVVFVGEGVGVAVMVAPYVMLFTAAFIRKELLTRRFFRIKNAEERINISLIGGSEQFKSLFQNPVLTFQAAPNPQLLRFIYNWLNRCKALKNEQLTIWLVSGELWINSDFAIADLSETGQTFVRDMDQFLCIDLNDLQVTDENREQFLRESRLMGAKINQKQVFEQCF